MLIIFSFLWRSCIILASESAELTNTESSLPGTAMVLGGRFSSDNNVGFVDLLVPVAGNESSFLFINPRIALSEGSQNEQNIGLGLRKLIFDENLIVGANIFYDSRKSSYGNRFDQIGVGVELLSNRIDARINSYWPLDNEKVVSSYDIEEGKSVVEASSWGDPYFTQHRAERSAVQTTTTMITRRHFDKIEEAPDGVDFEMGAMVPFLEKWVETRIFAGYYYYDNKYGKDIKGFKCRLELRTLPALTVDAEWYEDDKLHNTDCYVGVRLNLPFDMGGLFAGKNPFEGTGDLFKGRKRAFKERMMEMVVRDLDVIVEETDFIEDESKKTIEKTKKEKTLTDVLQDDITFVDGDNTGGENGTYEKPYNTIQEGVNNAFGDNYVHVGDVNSSYDENVVLKKGVKLWGSGEKVYGCETGKRPVVDGRSLGPAIKMADNTKVYGFRVINTDLGGPDQAVTIAGRTYDIKRIGTYGENVTNVEVRNNLIEGTSYGVLLAADTLGNFVTKVKNNTLRNNNEHGVWILGKGTSGTFGTIVSGNNISNNQEHGLDIYATSYDSASADISNITANNNEDGLHIFMSSASGSVKANISDITASENNDEGLYVYVNSNIDALTTIDTVTANGNSGDGLQAHIHSRANVDISNVTVNENSGCGLYVNRDSNGSDATVNIDNVTAGSNEWNGWAYGLYVYVDSDAGDATVNIDNATASFNKGDGAVGLFVNMRSDSGTLTANIDDLTANSNKGSAERGYGLAVDMKSNSGDALVDIDSLTANFNEGVDNGYGVRLGIWTDGNITVDIDDATANSNQGPGGGLVVWMHPDNGNAGLNLRNNTANSNQFNGIDVVSTTDTGNISLYGEHNVAANNQDNGVSVNMSTTGGGVVTIDFGGGGLGSPGLNSFYGNSSFQFSDTSSSSVTIKAENNYWNAEPPVDTVDYNSVNGTIDVVPYLTSDPSL